MQCRELHQDCAAGGSQLNAHAAAIRCDSSLPDELRARRAIDQSHYGVVSLLEEFRQLRNRGPAAPSESGDSQHQLMLLRGDAGLTGRSFTESQEQAQLISELTELPHNAGCGIGVQVPGHFFGSHWKRIISQRDIFQSSRHARRRGLHQGSIVSEIPTKLANRYQEHGGDVRPLPSPFRNSRTGEARRVPGRLRQCEAVSPRETLGTLSADIVCIPPGCGVSRVYFKIQAIDSENRARKMKVTNPIA